MVPTGYENRPTLARVVSTGDYIEEIVPYPVEKTKGVLHMATEAEIEVAKPHTKPTVAHNKPALEQTAAPGLMSRK